MMPLDLVKLHQATLHREPYEYITIPRFIGADALDAINQDFPAIEEPCNVPLERIEYSGAFREFVDAVQNPDFARALSNKFGFNIVGKPVDITIRRYSAIDEGQIHTDSVKKTITVLIYLNRIWPHKNGKIRVLRSATDIGDYSAELAPEKGNLLAFRRSDYSFHGYLPFEGERRAIQLNWIEPKQMSTLKRIKNMFGWRK